MNSLNLPTSKTLDSLASYRCITKTLYLQHYTESLHQLPAYFSANSPQAHNWYHIQALCTTPIPLMIQLKAYEHLEVSALLTKMYQYIKAHQALCEQIHQLRMKRNVTEQKILKLERAKYPEIHTIIYGTALPYPKKVPHNYHALERVSRSSAKSNFNEMVTAIQDNNEFIEHPNLYYILDNQPLRRLIHALHQNTHVTRLDLYIHNMHKPTAKQLKDYLCSNHALSELRLCGITDQSGEAVMSILGHSLKHMTGLRSLSIYHDSHISPACQAIANALQPGLMQNSTLREMSLYAEFLSPLVIWGVFNQRIRKLMIHGTLDKKLLPLFCHQLTKCPSVIELSIGLSPACDDKIAQGIVDAVTENKIIQDFTLWRESGMTYELNLAPLLLENRTIKTLHLGEMQLNDDALLSLLHGLCFNRSLTSLFITIHNFANPRVPVLLSRALQMNDVLTSLLLMVNKESENDTFLALAEGLKKNSVLSTLALIGNVRLSNFYNLMQVIQHHHALCELTAHDIDYDRPELVEPTTQLMVNHAIFRDVMTTFHRYTARYSDRVDQDRLIKQLTLGLNIDWAQVNGHIPLLARYEEFVDTYPKIPKGCTLLHAAILGHHFENLYHITQVLKSYAQLRCALQMHVDNLSILAFTEQYGDTKTKAYIKKLYDECFPAERCHHAHLEAGISTGNYRQVGCCLASYPLSELPAERMTQYAYQSAQLPSLDIFELLTCCERYKNGMTYLNSIFEVALAAKMSENAQCLIRMGTTLKHHPLFPPEIEQAIDRQNKLETLKKDYWRLQEDILNGQKYGWTTRQGYTRLLQALKKRLIKKLKSK